MKNFLILLYLRHNLNCNPNHGISTGVWDEAAIRRDERATLQAAHGCNLEFAMKDVHTLANQPWRLGRWVAIAREECEKIL